MRPYATVAALQAALDAGEVDAIATDASQLVAYERQRADQGRPVRLLPDSLSDEPIAVVLAENQSELRVRVNAVIQILRTAALLGVTAANAGAKAEQSLAPNADLALRELFGTASGSGLAQLGLDVDRVQAVIETTGNLTEMLARHNLETEPLGPSLVRLVDTPFGAAAPLPPPLANHPALISDPQPGVMLEDGVVSGESLVLTGQLTVQDPDGPKQEALRLMVLREGDPWGELTVDAEGRFRYSVANADPRVQALRNGEIHRDRFMVTSWDGTSRILEFQVAGIDDLRPVRVIDGYLAGATVFADLDGDGLLDQNQEPFAISDGQGLAQLDPGIATANWVSVGGTDITTNTTFVGNLRSLPGSTVISPLTTLVVELVVERGLLNGQERLLLALGLPTVDLGRFDPFATGVDPQLALPVQKVSAQLATISQLGLRSGVDAQALVRAIADRVLAPTDAPLDLAKASEINGLLQAAAPQLPDASIEALVQVLNRANGEIAAAASLAAIASVQGQALRGESTAPEEPTPDVSDPGVSHPGDSPVSEPDRPMPEALRSESAQAPWRQVYLQVLNRLKDRKIPKGARRQLQKLLLFLVWSNQ